MPLSNKILVHFGLIILVCLALALFCHGKYAEYRSTTSQTLLLGVTQKQIQNYQMVQKDIFLSVLSATLNPSSAEAQIGVDKSSVKINLFDANALEEFGGLYPKLVLQIELLKRNHADLQALVKALKEQLPLWKMEMSQENSGVAFLAGRLVPLEKKIASDLAVALDLLGGLQDRLTAKLKELPGSTGLAGLIILLLSVFVLVLAYLTWQDVVPPVQAMSKVVSALEEGKIPELARSDREGELAQIQNLLVGALNVSIGCSQLSDAVKNGDATFSIALSEEDRLWVPTVDAVNAAVSVLATAQKDMENSLGDFAEALSQQQDGYSIIVAKEYSGHLGRIKDQINESMRVQNDIVGQLKGAADQLVECHFDVSVEGEFGGKFDEVKTSMNSMIQNVGSMIGCIKDFTGIISGSAAETKELSTALHEGSKKNSEALQAQAAGTESISASFHALAATSEEISVNIANILSTAEQMSMNMSRVAKAIEDVSKAIGEVSKHSNDASQVAGKAMTMSDNATNTMNTLGVAATEIGKVTEVIKRIAEQTNLLALNATIEAASAGEAGKGFAVVAHEIKELANQSAQAAEGIASKISGIQTNTNEAIRVISEVNSIIKTINQSVGTISQTVDQQKLTTNDISLNASEAATGTSNITHAIAEISKGATDMSQTIGESANEIAALSQNIQGVSRVIQYETESVTSLQEGAEKLFLVANELSLLMQQFRV